jgi:uncharacterized ion transporter superfamily protein YfcC
VSGLGGVAFINLMFGLFLPLSFLIPSSSGSGDRRHADHGPARQLRERAAELVVTAYQTGERAGEPRAPRHRRS